MREIFIKIIAVAIAVLIVLTAYSLLRQNEIDEKIKEEKSEPISLRILSDKSSGTSPLTVNFKPLLLNNKNKVEYFWEFGDENTSEEEQPAYIYRESGIFNCKLTVKDGDTAVNDSLNITVFPNNPPDVKILVDKTTGFRPETVKFDAQVFDPEGEELTYLWKIKYPNFFSYEKVDTITEKNFTKTFWRNGNYVAELTVTDEAGNSGTQYIRIQISKSKIEVNLQSLLSYVSQFKIIVWPLIQGIFGPPIYKILDSFWLNLPSFLQKLFLTLLDLLGINYDPLLNYANLDITNITDINHSLTVNELGGVTTQNSESGVFTIKNNDSENSAKEIYITLVNPLSGEEGLSDSIELKELEIGIYANGISKKLFYDGSYKKKYKEGFFIDSLDYGDEFTGELVVTLKESGEGTFADGETYKCILYVLQEKADYVNEIPFTILT